MTDFEKFKTAAEEIKLSDAEKEELISVCEASKKNKKKSRFAPIAAAAAVAVFAFVIFSPGFLLKASEEDAAVNYAPQENMAVNDHKYLADSAGGTDSIILHSTTSKAYRKIYCEIPKEFRELVSEKEYTEWENALDASEGMLMVRFVGEFNISRESFEKANAAYARRIFSQFGLVPLMLAADCEEQEEAEIFNADIIYSFDKENIDLYYLKPDYEFDSMKELTKAAENGYVLLSEQAPEEYYLMK